MHCPNCQRALSKLSLERIFPAYFAKKCPKCGIRLKAKLKDIWFAPCFIIFTIGLVVAVDYGVVPAIAWGIIFGSVYNFLSELVVNEKYNKPLKQDK